MSLSMLFSPNITPPYWKIFHMTNNVRKDRCRGTMYSRTFASAVYTLFHVIYPKKIPALMAKGWISPDTAFVQSPLVLAFDGKTLLLQTITVLCTDGRVQWGVECVAGLVTHRSHLVALLIFSDAPISLELIIMIDWLTLPKLDIDNCSCLTVISQSMLGWIV